MRAAAAAGKDRRAAAARAAAPIIALLALCFATLPWSASAMRTQTLSAAGAPPSWSHPFGADALGRDLLARTLYGGALSLSLGVLSAVIAVVVGVTYGAIAGYVGGRVDEWMMRAVDVLFALPYLLLVMLLTASLGALLEERTALGRETSRFVVLATAIGGVSWLTLARVVRGQLLLIREEPYIDAARLLGLPTGRILLRHVLPRLTGPVIVFATLTAPQAILYESFLSFLGVGIQPPQATWGSLAAEGVRALNPIQTDWWLVVFPCFFLALTLVLLNQLGERLRALADRSFG